MENYSLSFKEQMAKSITQAETTKFVQLSLDKGQNMVKHKTPHHLNLILLSGQIRFTLEDEELMLEATDMITVEPGREHALEALEKSVALLVLVPVSKKEETPKP